MKEIADEEKLPSSKEDNRYTLAFWTCLQIERHASLLFRSPSRLLMSSSDILAELDVPGSGILCYQHCMPYPNASVLRFSQPVMESYIGQVFLRRRLYDASKPTALPTAHELELLLKSVDSKGTWAAPRYRFDEADAPASEILAARLRAQYWRTQVITLRPFIREVLDFNHRQRHRRVQGVPNPDHFRMRYKVTAENARKRLTKDVIIKFASMGVKAHVESTRAFDGIEKPLIIVDPFGVARAWVFCLPLCPRPAADQSPCSQWGNLLILDAVHRDPTLGQYIKDDVLGSLFDRTIDFLALGATIPRLLAQDIQILKRLRSDFHKRIGLNNE